MEISRLRAELACVKMERDILGKATATLQRHRREVRLHDLALEKRIYAYPKGELRRQLIALLRQARAAASAARQGKTDAGKFPRW
jgi:hypothetical protein